MTPEQCRKFMTAVEAADMHSYEFDCDTGTRYLHDGKTTITKGFLSVLKEKFPEKSILLFDNDLDMDKLEEVSNKLSTYLDKYDNVSIPTGPPLKLSIIAFKILLSTLSNPSLSTSRISRAFLASFKLITLSEQTSA